MVMPFSVSEMTEAGVGSTMMAHSIDAGMLTAMRDAGLSEVRA
jgi:hypothetical protein